jgi:hypothetical protein
MTTISNKDMHERGYFSYVVESVVDGHWVRHSGSSRESTSRMYFNRLKECGEKCRLIRIEVLDGFDPSEDQFHG